MHLGANPFFSSSFSFGIESTWKAVCLEDSHTLGALGIRWTHPDPLYSLKSDLYLTCYPKPPRSDDDDSIGIYSKNVMIQAARCWKFSIESIYHFSNRWSVPLKRHDQSFMAIQHVPWKWRDWKAFIAFINLSLDLLIRFSKTPRSGDLGSRLDIEVNRFSCESNHFVVFFFSVVKSARER